MSKSCCPDCGSGNAVGKAEAWDAAAAIPPKAQADLDRLRGLENAVVTVLKQRGADGHEDAVLQWVPLAALDALSEAFNTQR